MKSIFTTIVLIAGLLVQTLGFAQTRKLDQIFKRDGKSMSVIITEINDTQIVYKDPSKPNGTAIAIDKSKVNKAVFANGETEMFNITTTQKKSDDKTKLTTDKIDFFVTAGGGLGLLSVDVFDLLGLKQKSILSFTAGAGVHIPFGPIAIAPTITFSQFGGRFTDPTDATSHIDVKMQAVQVALPVMYQSGNSKSSSRFFVGIGPYATYAFSGKTTDVSGGMSADTPIDFTKEFNALHFGGLAQIGVRAGSVSIFGYGTQSFSNLAQSATQAKASATTFGLGVKFHF